MKREMGVFSIVLLVGGLAIFSGGCSSGGGNGSAVLYMGKTGKAVINGSNSGEIMAGFYSNETGSEDVGTGLAKELPDARSSRMLILGLHTGVASIIHPAKESQGVVSRSRPGELKKGVTETTETQSTCAGVTGSASETMTTDDQTGDFSGTITFDDYCDAGITLGLTYSGTASFSGAGDGTSDRITFSDFQISDETTSLAMEGEMDAHYPDDLTMEMDIDLVIVDNLAHKSYQLEGFHLSAVDLADGSYTEIDMAGKFYHSDYGYVEIETPTPLLFSNSGNGYPQSGVITATGADGNGGGPTVAKLTAYSDTEYRLRADTDGDGTFDFYTGLLLWDDLITN